MERTGHVFQPDRFINQAETLVRARAARTTWPRVRVLACLLAEKRPLSHHEIEERLPGSGQVDRATLYRVLEWLTAKGLAHKVVNEDRLWRFSAGNKQAPHQHPHFQCRSCDRVICLEDADTPEIALPPGYQAQQFNFTVTGVCAECS